MLLVRFILYFSPKFLKDKIYRFSQQKKLEKAKQNLKFKVSKTELKSIFDNLKLDSDVFVHSSLMDIGKIEGGYKEVVKLLNSSVLDKNHTLLFSALPYKGSSKDYLKSISNFDVRNAPVEMGVINEYYTTIPESDRSLSPTHSVIAIGSKSKEYTKYHHLSPTPFDENSPYFKLAQNKGKIMFFGAGISHITFIHVIEDLLKNNFPLNVYTKETYPITLVNKEGISIQGEFKAHSSFIGIFRNTDYLINQILKLPNSRSYNLGASKLILLDSKEVMIFLLEALKMGKTIYGKRKISKNAKITIENWISYFKNIN